METNQKDWYVIDNINEIDSPALVIYPERVKKNIALIKTMIDDVGRLRPHVKTHKCREASVLMMQAGINKFKCATIAEAEMLATVNAKDVLLAYQPIGPKLKRFFNLIEKFTSTNFSCLTDNIDAARQISLEASKAEINIPVYIDVNVGMNRTGIKPSDVAEFVKQCSNMSGIRIVGLHVYDGHIHDEDLNVRTKQANEVLESIKSLRKLLKDEGFENLVVVAGGSPT
ncbi:MAG: alanine racemase, partial [Flavisolibacter sp.]